jgi:hypothetical protein
VKSSLFLLGFNDSAGEFTLYHKAQDFDFFPNAFGYFLECINNCILSVTEVAIKGVRRVTSDVNKLSPKSPVGSTMK